MNEYDVLETMRTARLERKQRKLEIEVGKLVVKIFAIGVLVGVVVGALVTIGIAILTGVI